MNSILVALGIIGSIGLTIYLFFRAEKNLDNTNTDLEKEREEIEEQVEKEKEKVDTMTPPEKISLFNKLRDKFKKEKGE